MIRVSLLSAVAALSAAAFTGCDHEVAGNPAVPAQQAAPAVQVIEPLTPAKTVPVAAQAGQWVTIQGQVLFPKAKPLPVAAPLNVAGGDAGHCLSKGPLLDDKVIVNPKDRGLKNVWVYLRPATGGTAAKFAPNEIKPELLKPAAKTFDVDQPVCAFVPKIFAIREGDFVNFKNSSQLTDGKGVSHNTKLDADSPSPSFNKTIPAGQAYKDPLPFAAQRSPVMFSCSMHPWMAGKFMVFDHPYFAVTDDNGKFEIKDAPAGNYVLVYRHENGYHKGKDGAKGFPITIKADDKGTMKIQPIEFEFPEESK